MASSRKPWLSTREFFALAEREGIDLQAAAEQLLRSISSRSHAVKIVGSRRQWDPPSSAESREWFQADMRLQELCRRLADTPETQVEANSETEVEIKRLREVIGARYVWRERLPRDPQLRVVPKTFWQFFDGVDSNLTSAWFDDRESPEEFLAVDWLTGMLTSFLGYEREVYEGLCLDRGHCRDLIKRMLGRSDRRGAPSRPRNKDDLPVIQGILDAITNGDTRDCGKIAWDFIPESVAKTRAGDLMQRRACRWVRRKLEVTKKSNA